MKIILILACTQCVPNLMKSLSSVTCFGNDGDNVAPQPPVISESYQIIS
jgi:hypothetical protein